MPTYQADLSAASLDKLLSDVKAYKAKVDAAPAKIAEGLAKIGMESIQENRYQITDPDGNAAGDVGMQIEGSSAKVFSRGDQVAFLEYGTGEQGKASPHPRAGEAGWQYGVGSKIHRMKNGKRMWHYFDRLRGHWRTTNGIPAQKQVLRAAITMRDNIVPVAKEALK